MIQTPIFITRTFLQIQLTPSVGKGKTSLRPRFQIASFRQNNRSEAVLLSHGHPGRSWDDEGLDRPIDRGKRGPTGFGGNYPTTATAREDRIPPWRLGGTRTSTLVNRDLECPGSWELQTAPPLHLRRKGRPHGARDSFQHPHGRRRSRRLSQVQTIGWNLLWCRVTMAHKPSTLFYRKLPRYDPNALSTTLCKPSLKGLVQQFVQCLPGTEWVLIGLSRQIQRFYHQSIQSKSGTLCPSFSKRAKGWSIQRVPRPEIGWLNGGNHGSRRVLHKRRRE